VKDYVLPEGFQGAIYRCDVDVRGRH
jgi:hypothetical protein